ncbi:Dual specificity protein phosphatase, partial [Globisporangium splendens]
MRKLICPARIPNVPKLSNLLSNIYSGSVREPNSCGTTFMRYGRRSESLLVTTPQSGSSVWIYQILQGMHGPRSRDTLSDTSSPMNISKIILYPVAHMLWRYMSASLIQAIWCAHLRRMDSDPIKSTAEMAIMMTRLEAGMRNLTRLAEAQPGDSDGHTVVAVLKAYVDCFLSQTDAIPLTPSDTRGVYLLFFDGGSRGNPGSGGTGSIIVRVHKDSHTASLIWAASMAYSRKDTTNNFAEYWGLIHGLREAQRSHFEPLYVIGDSALIISQQRMHRSPRQHRLARLYQTSRRLADCIDIRGWHHHYCAFNKMADSAANLAMDTRTSTQVHFPTQRAAFNNLTQDLDNDVMHWLMRSSEDPRNGNESAANGYLQRSWQVQSASYDAGVYYRPSVTTFDWCMDALAKPDALLRVASNHERRPCIQEGLRDAVILLWFSDTPKRLYFVVPTEKFGTYQGVGNATTHSGAKMCEIQQLHFLNSERSLAVMHKRVDEDDARDTTAELGAAAAIGAADGDADSKAERIAASGSSSGFRKFRHLLMAKHFESRDNTPLFIGSFGAANNRDALQTHGISHILCVSPTLPLPYVDGLIYHHIDMNMNAITGGMHRLRRFPDAFTYLRIAVADLPSVRISESFPLALDFIDSAVLKGGCVLMHCFVGKSRSATLVLAYLVARKQMRLETALALLRRLRPETQPNSGFLAKLALWKSRLLVCCEYMVLTTTVDAIMKGGDNGDFGGDDGCNRDLILSRDEFEMLHALHRFVPLPALSSNILRIVCDNDLEVTHEEEESAKVEEEETNGGDKAATAASKRGSSGGAMRTTTSVASTHSPLTRRLSHRLNKPLLEIDLASQHQAQYQKKRHGMESTSSTSTSTSTDHYQQNNNISSHNLLATDE